MAIFSIHFIYHTYHQLVQTAKGGWSSDSKWCHVFPPSAPQQTLWRGQCEASLDCPNSQGHTDTHRCSAKSSFHTSEWQKNSSPQIKQLSSSDHWLQMYAIWPYIGRYDSRHAGVCFSVHSHVFIKRGQWHAVIHSLHLPLCLSLPWFITHIIGVKTQSWEWILAFYQWNKQTLFEIPKCSST